MNLAEKLKLIQEGYSLEDINSGSISLGALVESYNDDFTSFYESIVADLNHISQFNFNIINESENRNIIKRFIDWVIEKLRQFKMFIRNLFKKRQEEIVKKEFSDVKKRVDAGIEFKPFMVSNNLEKIINSPDEAIDILKKVFDQFEEISVSFMDNAYKGYNDTITPDTDIVKFQAIIWNKILGNNKIVESNNITESAIDKLLGKSSIIRISTTTQIENIVRFADKFYTLWEDVNQSLTYYEKQLKQLGEFADDGFKIIKLICETLLQTLPEIIRYVDSNIRRLSIIKKYL